MRVIWPGSAVTKADLTWNLETYRKAYPDVVFTGPKLGDELARLSRLIAERKRDEARRKGS